MSHPLPAVACRRWHHAHLRLRFLTPGLSLLFCDACEAFRSALPSGTGLVPPVPLEVADGLT